MVLKNYGGFRDLIVWKEAKNLMVLTYKLTEKFPRNEEFGLTIQMRKCSVSIMSQIAEGWIRKSEKQKLNYLEISEGSLLELENQGEAASAVGYWTLQQYEEFNAQRAKVLICYSDIFQKSYNSEITFNTFRTFNTFITSNYNVAQY